MPVVEQATITSNFAEIRQQAELYWQQLWNSSTPVVMVGTAACGRAAGDPLGESKCQECGECVDVCPVGALTYKEGKEPKRADILTVIK
jgi:ferredoxin